MAKVKDSFESTIDLSEPVRLEVGTGSGEISITRGEDGRLTTSSQFQVRARSKEEAKKVAERIKEDPPIEIGEGLIQIGNLSKYGLGSWPFGPAVVFDFLIEAPAETEVRLDSGSGNQEVRDLKGPIRADAGSGDIRIEDIDSAVDVDTGSGDIKVSNATGDVTADAGSGDVSLSAIKGGISVDVGSGDVILRQIGGSVKVGTGSGDIRVDSLISSNVRWDFAASSGDVELLLPSDSQFTLELKTSSGEIEVDFPLTTCCQARGKLEGKVGESPTATISIKTSSGDIRIKAKVISAEGEI